jgi:MFS family permease
MMAVFFVGLGASAVLCGSAAGPTTLQAGLALLGVFAAIYHPVGLPWLVRHARQRGRALGVNGIFGSLGVALAGVVAGALSDSIGWRAAFVIPGACSVIAGAALAWCIRRGLIPKAPAPTVAATHVARPRMGSLLWVLVFTMVSGAMIYQATQAALPKTLALTLQGFVGDGTVGVGALVGLVYGVASLTQVFSGQLADRYSLPAVYLVTWFLQVPILWAMSWVGGWSFVAMAVLAVVINTGALPAENLLLAESTPPDRQGLAFGLRFVLVFGATPVSLWVVSAIGRATGGFGAVFVLAAVVAALAGTVALRLRTASVASASTAAV